MSTVKAKAEKVQQTKKTHAKKASSAPRTFVVKKPLMKGHDVKAWQQEVKKLFKKLGIDCPIKADGVFGMHTRAYTADLVHASGLSSKAQMPHGEVTPHLRIKLRNNDLTVAQKKTKSSKARADYRAKLKKQYKAQAAKVHAPTNKITTDAWGWHPGVHDGVDVCTPPDAICYAMVKCEIIDVRSSGWWNLGAPNDPSLKAKGDGIVQMRVLENVGPFKKGMHIGYGHQEKAVVKVGQIVEAGHMIGHAGFANAWHIHLMVNQNSDTRGVGTIDPRPLIDYAIKNG